MEVDILISSSLEKISSPCNLTTEIGVPSGANLRLFRDPVREGQSRMVVCCDKRAASRLRRRFSAPRVYAHNGQLLSLTFVGMRPIADRHPESLPRGLYSSGAIATAPKRKGGTVAAGGGERADKSLRAWVLPPPSSSPAAAAAAGVEFALEWVEQQASEADARRVVPGIADLYEEFMRTCKQYADGEEKSRDFMAEKELAIPSAAAETKYGDQPRPRHRSWRGEEKWEEDGKEQEKGKKEKHSSVTKAVRQRKLATSQKQRCRRRHGISIDEVTSALNRISSNFADAPKPVERIEVVSLLAKIYANGTAFTDNLPRCCEALDHLGIVRWRARTYPEVPVQVTAMATMATPSTAAGKGWLRVLGRVVGLVRGFIDFGAFLQVYVLAAERERSGMSAAAAAAVNEEKKTSDNEQDQGGREPRRGEQRGDDDVSPQGGDSRSTREGRHGLDFSGNCSREGQSAPESSDADAETIEHHHQGGKEELLADSYYPLPWLFPNSKEEDGKLAFNRLAVCGSSVHAKITLEAAARIVRDAGKVFPSERAWRWCCEKKALEGGRLLTFQDFVEMCEGLEEHMTTASLMSPEDKWTSTAESPVATTVDVP